MRTIFYNGIIYTGHATLSDHAVETEACRITRIQPWAEVTGKYDSNTEWIDLKGGALAPAFIDLQIYGGQGRLFSEHPSVEAIRATYMDCLEGGTAYFQPTVATQSEEVMDEALSAVREYQALGLPGVLGLHLEGPYIHPSKKGAHHLAYVQIPHVIKVKSLLEKANGLLSMMTLAPERCSPEVIRLLIDEGVVVSAGHTDATYEEALVGFSLGVSAATHLFNAMSPLNHRAPGMTGALLDGRPVYASIVADGHHVAFSVIRVAKQLMGDKLFLITDAVTANDRGTYRHRLSGDKYVLPDGTLSGSSLTMMTAVRNCVEQVGIPLDEALRMASLYPARLMGLDASMGSIEVGKEATLVGFDPAYRVIKVWVA